MSKSANARSWKNLACQRARPRLTSSSKLTRSRPWKSHPKVSKTGSEGRTILATTTSDCQRRRFRRYSRTSRQIKRPTASSWRRSRATTTLNVYWILTKKQSMTLKMKSTCPARTIRCCFLWFQSITPGFEKTLISQQVAWRASHRRSTYFGSPSFVKSIDSSRKTMDTTSRLTLILLVTSSKNTF